jgi:hypothetical protein
MMQMHISIIQPDLLVGLLGNRSEDSIWLRETPTIKSYPNMTLFLLGYKKG